MKPMTTKQESRCAVIVIETDKKAARFRPKTIQPGRHHVIRIIAVTDETDVTGYWVPVHVSNSKDNYNAGSAVSSPPHQPGCPATISTASANSGTPEQSSRANGTVAVAEVLAEGGRGR